jgi:hypothetical protein
MKLNFQYILIAVLSIAVILLLLKDCDRPSEEKEADRKKMFETEVAILKQEKREIQSRQDSTVKRYNDKVVADSIQLAAQNQRIKALQSKLTIQRPKVIEKIQADSAVLSYVNTLEEVVTELQVQNDTLKAQNEFQRKLNDELITLEITEDKIDAAAKIEYEFRIHELEKQAKKEKRKKKLGKLIAVIAGGVGLFLGSQL